MAETGAAPEKLTLPEPARTVWKRAVRLLREMKEASREREVLVGGGTILACRWGHRGSTDIDVITPGLETLKPWMENEPGDAARMVGGQWRSPSEEHLTILIGDGTLDVTATRPWPRLGARNAQIAGSTTAVLSTTQILRGKLNRAGYGNSPVRDLFDFATAAERDSNALAEAVGMLRREEIGEIARNWREREEEYGMHARRELRTRDGKSLEFPEIGRVAAEAVESHRTIQVEWKTDTDGNLLVHRTLEDRRKITHTLGTEEAERAAETCGLAAYMAHNEGSTAAEVINGWRSGPRRKPAGVIYDSRTAPPGTPEADRDPLAGLGRPKDQTAQKNRRAMEQEIKERWMRRQDPTPGRKRLVALLKRRVRMERSEAEQRAAAEPPALPDRGSGYAPSRSASRRERNGRGR